MKTKKKEDKSMVEIAIATGSGIGYFYLVYFHFNIDVLNPHLVFFVGILGLFIASVILNRAIFALTFTVSAVISWIIMNTDIVKKVEEFFILNF